MLIQNLLYLQIFAIFLLDFLAKRGLVVRQLTWLPDIMSGVLLIMVVILMSQRRVIELRPAYYIIFAFLVIHVLSGVIINDVEIGPLFTGIRTYFRYVPFFVIPAVYAFKDEEISKQLKLIMALLIIQLPISLYQRFIEGKGMLSGDVVKGTFTSGSQMSIFLVCSIGILVGFYLRGMIKRNVLIVAIAFLFIPTTIGETLGVFILLPIAVIAPYLLRDKGEAKVKNILKGAILLVPFMVVFTLIYDGLYGSTRHGALEMYTNIDQLQAKLAPKTAGISSNPERQGRFDVIVKTWDELSKDPFALLYGKGIGNVSESFLGRAYSGKYYEEYGDLVYLAITKLLWELGVVGVTLCIMSFWYLFKDTLFVSDKEGLMGAFASGWAGVILVLVVSMIYKNVIGQNATSYLFWYFSGLIASRAVRVDRRFLSLNQ